jgi:large-conductance mechanosensitive channel
MITSIKQFFSEQDKQKHIAGSAIGVNVLYLAVALFVGHGWLAVVNALVAMLVVAIVKEFFDDNTMLEHLRDMLANSIGISTVFVWTIKF